MQFGGATPAGSSRALRLDPFHLPMQFPTEDAEADGQLRVVELHPSRVLLRRAVRGMRMVINLPIESYLGVALRLHAPSAGESGSAAIVLEHRDPALSVPLWFDSNCDSITADCHIWARRFGLPVLVADARGNLREPIPRMGKIRVAQPARRRRRSGALRGRRPSMMLRRGVVRSGAACIVHRGEREIIAPE
jgi:hypothetical protein